MAKYKFYQDKEVKAWVRDYFTVEAESLEEAIEFLKNEGEEVDYLECTHEGKVEFDYRDTDALFDCMEECERFELYSCDLEAQDQDSLVFRG